MSKGYITIALNSGKEDYVKSAYCLALSLKLTQKDVNRLSIVTDRPDDVPEKYREVFEHVVKLPDRDLAAKSSWKVENYYQLYVSTPYDETVTLDADMLFFDDLSHWWQVMGERDVVIADTIFNYKGLPITHNPLRLSFYEYGLPDIHNGFLYFKKSESAEKLFTAIRDNALDWQTTCMRMFGRTDIHYSSDCALAIAVKENQLLEQYTLRGQQIPTFVHMKTCMQGWEGVTDKDWRKYTEYHFDEKMNLYIGGEKIRYPFHYHIREFASDEIIASYERVLGI